jgi:membrane protease YdiL (CAAX protease family)
VIREQVSEQEQITAQELEPESRQNAAMVPNSQSQVQARVEQGTITWTGPLLVVVGRSALMFVAQGLVAAILALQGSRTPWLSAGTWWTIYGTIVDLGCLLLMWHFLRREGITLRNLIGPVRWRYGRDLFVGIGFFLLVFPLFVGGGLLSAVMFYGTAQVTAYPGILGGRVLPIWAVIYSLSLWWIIWSPTEEMTYQAYVLPRFQALSGRAWIAVVVVSFWWTAQHCFLPFIPDLRLALWRFFAFLPGVIALALIYLRTRRLAPLILAHWLMDISAAVMTIQR